MNYILLAFKKYAVFSGRASRAEYWYFVLFNFIIAVALGLINAALFHPDPNRLDVLALIYAIVIAIPTVAVLVRRLHDVGKSTMWILVGSIPYIGWLWILILTLQDSIPGPNEYGPNPKEIGISQMIQN